MSLFTGPEEHAANPPDTWQVVKVYPRMWHLTTVGGDIIDTYTTRKAAEHDKAFGRWASLYEAESRWYAGESVRGWKPYQAVGNAPQ